VSPGDAGPVLACGGTHLYPGATGRIDGALVAGACLVEFADGIAQPGVLETAGSVFLLSLTAHTTARGTRVGPGRWKLEPLPGGRRFRIAGRAAP